MTALAWPLVVLVLGLLAFRAFALWHDAQGQVLLVAKALEEREKKLRAACEALQAAVEADGRRLDSLGGVVARLQALEEWRQTLRNRNGGRD